MTLGDWSRRIALLQNRLKRRRVVRLTPAETKGIEPLTAVHGEWRPRLFAWQRQGSCEIGQRKTSASQ